jgi:hypothetical protein
MSSKDAARLVPSPPSRPSLLLARLSGLGVSSSENVESNGQQQPQGGGPSAPAIQLKKASVETKFCTEVASCAASFDFRFSAHNRQVLGVLLFSWLSQRATDRS